MTRRHSEVGAGRTDRPDYGADAAAADARLLAAVAAVRAGDEVRALEHALRALYPSIRRHLRRQFPRLADDVVDDLTQEAMARVARGLPGARAGTAAQLLAWGYRVAARAAMNYLEAPRSGARTARQLVPLDASEASGLPAESSDGPDAPAVGRPASGAGNSRDALVRAAVAAYARLPTAEQELLWHRLVEGRGWEELGRLLGASGPAVKRRFERACAKLGQQLRAEAPGPAGAPRDDATDETAPSV